MSQKPRSTGRSSAAWTFRRRRGARIAWSRSGSLKRRARFAMQRLMDCRLVIAKIVVPRGIAQHLLRLGVFAAQLQNLANARDVELRFCGNSPQASEIRVSGGR